VGAGPTSPEASVSGGTGARGRPAPRYLAIRVRGGDAGTATSAAEKRSLGLTSPRNHGGGPRRRSRGAPMHHSSPHNTRPCGPRRGQPFFWVFTLAVSFCGELPNGFGGQHPGMWGYPGGALGGCPVDFHSRPPGGADRLARPLSHPVLVRPWGPDRLSRGGASRATNDVARPTRNRAESGGRAKRIRGREKTAAGGMGAGVGVHANAPGWTRYGRFVGWERAGALSTRSGGGPTPSWPEGGPSRRGGGEVWAPVPPWVWRIQGKRFDRPAPGGPAGGGWLPREETGDAGGPGGTHPLGRRVRAVHRQRDHGDGVRGVQVLVEPGVVVGLVLTRGGMATRDVRHSGENNAMGTARHRPGKAAGWVATVGSRAGGGGSQNGLRRPVGHKGFCCCPRRFRVLRPSKWGD